MPNSQDVVVIVDNTTSGQSDLATLTAMNDETLNLNVRIFNISDYSWREIPQQLASISSNVPVLLLSAYRDRYQQSISFNDSFREIRNHLTAFFTFGITVWVTGSWGVLISHEEKQAGWLDGISDIDWTFDKPIPVLQQSPNLSLLDFRQLQRFNIPSHLSLKIVLYSTAP